MEVWCAWCKKFLRVVEGNASDISHGICSVCFDKEIAKLRPSEDFVKLSEIAHKMKNT